MDFVFGLPRTVSHQEAILVVIDRFSKVAHFIPISMTYSIDKLAALYIKEIVRLHGVPISIVQIEMPYLLLDSGRVYKKLLGTRLKFSTAFHSQTDGQSERTIQIFKDMVRACIMDFQGS